MCEIFSLIGSSILASAGIAGASASAATGLGIASAAATLGNVAATGLGIANSIRSANETGSQVRAAQNSINSTVKVTNATEKTAAQLAENTVPKRTITSLRVPLNKTVNANPQLNTTTANTGLNIPM